LIKKFILGLLLVSSVAQAELFQKDTLGIGVALGSGSLTVGRTTEDYFLLGASAEYFVMDNLSVGLGVLSWIGGTPTLNQFTLPLTYYMPLSERFRPYAGVFFRETLVSDGYDNYSSYGAKLGLAYILSRNSYIGFAMVSEKYGSNSLYEDSSSTYPEITFAFSF